MEINDVYQALCYVQSRITVLKSQKNQFGGYSFRNVEDIHAAAKPLCAEIGATYFLDDNIVIHGERYYVESTAMFVYGGQAISVSAFAREQESRKSMDESQVTGSASSYARKYALCGLFAIDNEKDADSMDNRQEGTPDKPVDESKLDELVSLIEQFGLMRGKSAQEVIDALMASRTMVNLDAKWDNLTAIQAESAIKVVKMWISTAKKSEE